MMQGERRGFVEEANETGSSCDARALPVGTRPVQQVLLAGPGWGDGPKE